MASQTSGTGPGATPSGRGAPSGDRPATPRPGDRSGRPSTSPLGTSRAGRRQHVRPGVHESFFQRYRTWLIGAALAVVVAVVGAGVFVAATQPVFACSSIWQPAPTASPAVNASPQPGYVQPDMGNQHVPVGTVIKYTYCPPASGKHYFASGVGPIPARVYGPTDNVVPDGWVHNLEHGGLVVLYRGADVDVAALQALYAAIPPSPVCGFPPGGQAPSPVIARFDQMAWPFAALVWDRVLPLQTLDQAAILDLYKRYGEVTNPEKLCQPSASPSAPASPETSAAPS
jgi:hypothetical protein